MQEKPPTRPSDRQALARQKTDFTAEGSPLPSQPEPATQKPEPPTVAWVKRPTRRVLRLPLRLPSNL